MIDKPRVRILLDVDGVLNAVCREPNPDQWPDWDEADCAGFIIRFSPTVGKRLLALAEIPGVEILWLTTWEDRANEWISPLFGWPPFDIAGNAPWREKGEWWKLTIAREIFERDLVPFVWIDDDLNDRDAQEWIGTLTNEQVMGIRPATHKGLTDMLLGRIEEFVHSQLA